MDCYGIHGCEVGKRCCDHDCSARNGYQELVSPSIVRLRLYMLENVTTANPLSVCKNHNPKTQDAADDLNRLVNFESFFSEKKDFLLQDWPVQYGVAGFVGK